MVGNWIHRICIIISGLHDDLLRKLVNCELHAHSQRQSWETPYLSVCWNLKPGVLGTEYNLRYSDENENLVIMVFRLHTAKHKYNQTREVYLWSDECTKVILLLNKETLNRYASILHPRKYRDQTKILHKIKHDYQNIIMLIYRGLLTPRLTQHRMTSPTHRHQRRYVRRTNEPRLQMLMRTCGQARKSGVV